MKRTAYFLFSLLVLFGSAQTFAQSKADLKRSIEQIVASKKATVGVAIVGGGGKDELVINGDRRYPMQSVFKFHIGLAMMSEIDKGKFSLDQKIEIKKSELLPGLYSPIREAFPEGTTLTIAEILKYTVSQSDNVGCDVLLKLLGGPKAVEDYFVKHRFKNISIKINEETMQGNWDRQFENWTTPKAANNVLKAFFENKKKLLSQKSHEFIWRIMRETSTGAMRLKGQLPEGTVVAHKTGYSGAHKTTGVYAAVNDIGIVFLPNGKHFYISVFVSESQETFETNEKIIADIAKATWDHFASDPR
ncbi:MAG TPA: class A beta-lactamase, subclass A2 [Pyrinomonadaceae bacterium]|nr:class A beta-lactamase, subclass A2 [Pyrinomonadaceae bacterium]